MPNLDAVIATRCFTCNNIFQVAVNQDDYYSWKRGKMPQDAFSYLTADDRELLISHTCGKCFDATFRQMFKPQCSGVLTATSTIVWEQTVEVLPDGNVRLVDEGWAVDVLDAYELWCSECGMVTYLKYPEHGIADDWCEVQ